MVKWENGKVTFELDDRESISYKIRSDALPEKGKVQIGIAADDKVIIKDLSFEIVT